jgi:hypothetical protein
MVVSRKYVKVITSLVHTQWVYTSKKIPITIFSMPKVKVQLEGFRGACFSFPHIFTSCENVFLSSSVCSKAWALSQLNPFSLAKTLVMNLRLRSQQLVISTIFM